MLARACLDVWFKGGTSVSKGIGLIERFSEDLDLKLEPGSVWRRSASRMGTFACSSLACSSGELPSALSGNNEMPPRIARVLTRRQIP